MKKFRGEKKIIYATYIINNYVSPEKYHTVSQRWYCPVTTLLALHATVNCILKTHTDGKVYRIPLVSDL